MIFFDQFVRKPIIDLASIEKKLIMILKILWMLFIFQKMNQKLLFIDES